MKQSIVTVRLNGNPYQIGCEPDQEGHVAQLGEEVEEVIQGLVASVGQIGEARLLAMVALILADRAGSQTTKGSGVIDTDQAAIALEKAAQRISVLASRLTTP
jgi:cell division protein ZapA